MKKNNHSYNVSDAVKNVSIEDKILPTECANRLGFKQTPQYIVIHEVSLGLGRSNKIYNMEHYAEKIKNDGMAGIKIGYHYLVGDKTIYQFIPDDESTRHTGTDINYCSIGIERLICEGVRYPDALHNQAKLAATLMVKWDIPLSRVISHKSAKVITGTPIKECPNRLIKGQYGGFRSFYREIYKCLKDNDLFFELLVEKYSYEEEKKLIDSKRKYIKNI